MGPRIFPPFHHPLRALTGDIAVDDLKTQKKREGNKIILRSKEGW
jgi:hypothetical protein